MEARVVEIYPIPDGFTKIGERRWSVDYPPLYSVLERRHGFLRIRCANEEFWIKKQAA